MLRSRTVAWVCSAIVVATSARAADEPIPVREAASTEDVASAEEDLFAIEEEMVTAASRNAEPVRRAPASVTIVSGRELRAFAFDDVSDALLGVRGLYLTDDRFYVSLGIRGFNRFGDYGNRLQVQLDGHVMNDDWISSSYIGNDQLSDIEHVDAIEVVRGPGSALYGTGAFFGVVNLVTPRQAPPYLVRAKISLIDSRTARLHVDGGWQAPGGGPGFWLSLAGQGRGDTDYRSAAYTGTPWAKDGVAAGADAFTTGTIVGKAFWGDLTLALSLHQRNRRIPTGTFGTVFGDRRNQANDRRGFAELRYEPRLTPWLQLLTRVAVDHQSYEGHYAFQDAAFSPSNEHFDALWGVAEARLLITPLDELKITTGAEYQLHPFNHWLARDEPQPEPYIDQSTVFHYLGAYATADWHPWSFLAVSAGARLDANVNSAPLQLGDAPLGFLASVNPRFALILMPSDDDTVKLMLGRSFRMPSVYELSSAPDPPGFSFARGPPLLPETIYTGELEYRRRLPWDLQLIGSAYVNRVSDLLSYVATAEEVTGYENVVDPLWTLGAELEARHEVKEGLLLAAQYSFQRTRQKDPFAGDLVPNSPEHMGAVWVLLPVSGERLQVATRVVVDLGRLDRDLLPTSPAVIWDATLSGHVVGTPVSWAAGVRNVLDWRYEHPVSERLQDVRLPQDGRTIHLELSATY